jgi:hypothetical protein
MLPMSQRNQLGSRRPFCVTQSHSIPLGRRPYGSDLLPVPSGGPSRKFPPRTDPMRSVSSAGTKPCQGPRPYCPRMDARLSAVPRTDHLDDIGVQSRGNHERMRGLSPRQLPGHYQSQPCCAWISYDLRGMSQHECLQIGEVDSAY